MRICIRLNLARALAISSLLQMEVTNAYSQVNADAAGVKNKGSQVSSTSICQGQYEHKRTNYNPFIDTRPFAHSCDDHPGFTVWENCVSNTEATAASLCKNNPYYTLQRAYPSTDGNQCGYAWVTVTCWSG
jgi:hypothetical protein